MRSCLWTSQPSDVSFIPSGAEDLLAKEVGKSQAADLVDNLRQDGEASALVVDPRPGRKRAVGG